MYIGTCACRNSYMYLYARGATEDEKSEDDDLCSSDDG